MSASEIAHLRAQILQLESRRADLYTTLLNLRTSHSLLPPSTLPKSATPYNPTPTTTQTPSQIPLETLHRIPGITFFTLSHPQEGLKLGIRFDIFSAQHSIFLEPYWIILQRCTDPETGEEDPDRLELDWTNIPAALKPEEVCSRHLKGDDDEPPKKDPLTPLATELRKTLQTYTARREAVLGLVPVVGEENVTFDDLVNCVEIESADGKFRLWVEGEGEVVRVVARDEAGKRRRDVEKRMVGSVQGLPARMGWDQAGEEGEGEVEMEEV
ncbi:hypothetical protein BJ508DRAFT_418326 [Ascobolus immersus RN42]|uniref:Cenp-O kinetochore centromere component n=1 Tax=Ascobolus immersus RN42 TaxID=1160509 RepID=A0A3N4HPX7_ASCIM|nr:hypothetical protein BJ508DRAFT_418326 [Ascobolus immersus RN42]